jgi:hypothetical protein
LNWQCSTNKFVLRATLSLLAGYFKEVVRFAGSQNATNPPHRQNS